MKKFNYIHNYMLVEAEYFQSFRCLASACKNNCCHEWNIDIDRSSYHKIMSCKKSPEIEALVRKGIRRRKKEVMMPESKYAFMRLNEQSSCFFLDQNGLCSLQRECGYAVLPSVCRKFPRNVAIIHSYVEKSCSCACEEVVRLLWDLPHELNFLCSPVEHIEAGKTISSNISQPAIYRHIFELQTFFIDLLQDRAYSLEKRLILMGISMDALSKIEHTDDDEEISRWLQRYKVYTKSDITDTLNHFLKQPERAVVYGIEMMKKIFLEESSGMWTLFSMIQHNLKLALDTSGEVTVDLKEYQIRENRFIEFQRDHPYFLDNILVNQFFLSVAPLDEKGVWHNYLQICIKYSFLKFLLISCIDKEITQEDVLRIVPIWGRAFEHNQTRLDECTKDLMENHSDTLAHMAILING